MRMPASDWELLQEYVTRGSNDAFAELVRRHAALVYSICRRQLGDSHLAEDASQAVFILLARKAGSIGKKTVLEGWLFNTARYTCANLIRNQRLRRHHEIAAIATRADHSQSDSDQPSPVINDALARLASKDREALLLRFFQGHSLRQVGELMSVSEEAAKKRVHRGIERLRQLLTVESETAMSVVATAELLSRSIEPAPTGFIHTTLSAVTHHSGPAAELAGKVMTMMFYKKIAVIVAACVIFGGLTAAALATNRVLHSNHNSTSSARLAVAKTTQSNPQPKPAQQDVQDKLRRQLPAVQMDEVGLQDVFGFMRDVSGVDFAIDWDALNGAGIKVNTPVSINVRGVTFSGALRILLWTVAEPGVLDYAVRKGTLLVSISSALGLAPAKEDSSANQDAKRFLQQTVSQFPLDKKPLDGVLNDLARVHRFSIWVRWNDLKKAGVERDTPITLNAANLTSVANRLDSILSAANAKEPLGYAIVDGLVIITTAEAAKKLEQLGQVDHTR